MDERILVTGSSGLIGHSLCNSLVSEGIQVTRLDLRGSGEDLGDVRDIDRVRRALQNCDGVVHLAAVSRVIWAEREPERCWSTNIVGLRNVLDAANRSGHRPWVIFASSREVYGQPERLPADEDCPIRPVNVYGRSKANGERLVEAAGRDGVRASIIRLSNVFGSPSDHADRVVPAFARAVVEGRPLRVDGPGHTFDFTHIEDVTRGIVALARLLSDGEPSPAPIQFVTGQPTTLGELAEMAIDIASSSSSIRLARPRDFDVARFYGSAARARSILGWRPRVSLREGLARLIKAFRDELCAHQDQLTVVPQTASSCRPPSS